MRKNKEINWEESDIYFEAGCISFYTATLTNKHQESSFRPRPEDDGTEEVCSQLWMPVWTVPKPV